MDKLIWSPWVILPLLNTHTIYDNSNNIGNKHYQVQLKTQIIRKS
jgi:hypothetical protein